jgi:hypothetical protein
MMQSNGAGTFRALPNKYGYATSEHVQASIIHFFSPTTVLGWRMHAGLESALFEVVIGYINFEVALQYQSQ